MSKKLYTINSETFKIEEHEYTELMKEFKNLPIAQDAECIEFCYTGVQYYFSRTVAVKVSNKLLSEKLDRENYKMQCALDDYYSHRKFIEEFSGKVIK
jgi:hypothetical protein